MFIVTFGVQDFLTGKWSLVTIETGKSTIEDAFQFPSTTDTNPIS